MSHRDFLRAVLVVALGWITCGCGPREPQMHLCDPSRGFQLELVAEDVDLTELAPYQDSSERVPAGLLPSPFTATEAETSGGYWAVEGYTEETPDGGGRRSAVWLFTAEWEPLGMIADAQRTPENGQSVGLVSGSNAPMFAVGRVTDDPHGQSSWEIAVVEPPSVNPRRICSRSDGSRMSSALWVGDLIVILYEYGQGECIGGFTVDPSTGAQREIWTESTVADPEEGRVDMVWGPMASPDGRYVAFTRMTTSHTPHRHQWSVWMLDLTVGTAEQVTYEEGDSYLHAVVRWDSPRSLLFSRRAHERGEDHEDLWRLHVPQP